MRIIALIFLFTVAGIAGRSQISLKTSVPSKPVVVGESFPVQYVFPGIDLATNFKVASFSPFRYVSGPHQYNGLTNTANGSLPVTNFSFTLEATRPGRFIIPAASATINGKLLICDEAVVNVISKEDAIKSDEKSRSGNSEYFLAPGDDPLVRIKQNLFLKVTVDRNACYPGEPVLATFKLYSRLQSSSDIVKNPGFYGFTVYDMVNLSDKQVSIETLNGKSFDVHTLRKVQLFPLRDGVFTIDPMEVVNDVEFSKSVVNKKTEQEIVEGVLGNDKSRTSTADVLHVETRLSTDPVTIRVKTLPANKTAAFNGAVGRFNISAVVVKNKIARNEENFLEIIVEGQGNLTQIVAPAVNWPKGLEGFDPVVSDTIDKTNSPIKGTRVFRYPFIPAAEGSYTIPSILFSYFDPLSGYHNDSTRPLSVDVTKEMKKLSGTGESKTSITEVNNSASKVAGIIIFSAIVIILLYWTFHKKKPGPVEEQKKVKPKAEDYLPTAKDSIHHSDREFYTALRQSAWSYFAAWFELSGSEMNKEILMTKLENAGVSAENRLQLGELLRQCEAGMYTMADLGEDKQAIFGRTTEVLSAIEKELSARS